jgi:hypothetical protein
MADDPHKRGAGDRLRINVHQVHELRHWTAALGVSEDELRQAVEAVGPMAEDVRQWFRDRRGHHPPS